MAVQACRQLHALELGDGGDVDVNSTELEQAPSLPLPLPLPVLRALVASTTVICYYSREVAK